MFPISQIRDKDPLNFSLPPLRPHPRPRPHGIRHQAIQNRFFYRLARSAIHGIQTLVLRRPQAIGLDEAARHAGSQIAVLLERRTGGAVAVRGQLC